MGDVCTSLSTKYISPLSLVLSISLMNIFQLFHQCTQCTHFMGMDRLWVPKIKLENWCTCMLWYYPLPLLCSSPLHHRSAAKYIDVALFFTLPLFVILVLNHMRDPCLCNTMIWKFGNNLWLLSAFKIMNALLLRRLESSTCTFSPFSDGRTHFQGFFLTVHHPVILLGVPELTWLVDRGFSMSQTSLMLQFIENPSNIRIRTYHRLSPMIDQ